MITSTPLPVLPRFNFLGKIISWIFHPLFIPFYISWIILTKGTANTWLYNGDVQVRILSMVAINTILFPALVVLLLWRLGFSSGIYLQSQRDRIIPLTVSIIFYFWAFYVSRNLEFISNELRIWLLGVFLASCLTMLCNIFFKISLHTVAAGGMLIYFILQYAVVGYWPVWFLCLLCVLAGLIGTGRMLVNAHTNIQLYAGYAVGAIAQFAAWLIL